MVTAKNEKELLDILKLVCEEASFAAIEALNETPDPEASRYKDQFSKDEDMFGNLSEEELAGDEAEEQDEGESEEEAVEDVDDAPSEFGVSFDSVISAINALRSGRSLRDSSVKQQALDYYDRLDTEERKILLLFLNSLSDILTGETDGASAIDPSDPPHSLKISSGEEEQEEIPSEEAAPIEDEDEDPVEDEEEEDTSPPIKVNESQDLSALRKKIRKLML
jgi:hypothetical protein